MARSPAQESDDAHVSSPRNTCSRPDLVGIKAKEKEKSHFVLFSVIKGSGFFIVSSRFLP